MTGEKRMFSSYEKNDDPQRAIAFGDGNQGLDKGLGKIAISPDQSISNVFLVDSLDYNLLSVSQLCKIGYNCIFRRSDDLIGFNGVLDGQLYLVDFNDNNAELDTCLIAKTNMGWLCYRRLAHAGMKNLHKLLKGEHILGLTNVHFEKDRICSACQAGKQVGTHHPHKNIIATERPLELLHMDLFGPIAYISIGRSKYCDGTSKSLGPPTVVLVQWTSDNPAGAPESLDKFSICFHFLSQERFTCHVDITKHRRYENAEAITITYIILKVRKSYNITDQKQI
jgi:hypothetical protein